MLAVALAWLTERSDLPGARLWAWLAVAPLAVPAFVHSYAWVSLVPGLHGLLAGVLVSVLAYFPFLYLPVAAQLRRLDPALEDVAASLGLGPWQVFLRVVLPQLRLAICGGSLLIGLHLLAEYGLYVLIRFDTFTTAIVDQFQSAYQRPGRQHAGRRAGRLLPRAAGARGAAARRRALCPRRLRRGARRQPRGASAGPTLPCLLLPVVTALLALGVPLVTLGRWLVVGGAEVWRLRRRSARRFGQTVVLALAGGAARPRSPRMPMAWLSVRAPGRLQRAARGLPLLSSARCPASSWRWRWSPSRCASRCRSTRPSSTLLLAYVLLFLPRALVGLRASIAQAPVELEQAAMASAARRCAALWSDHHAPGRARRRRRHGAGALGITTELTATLMLAPNGTRTLATEFWSLTSEIDYAAAAPYALAHGRCCRCR